MEVRNLNLNGIVGLFDNNFGDWGATRTGIFVGLHGVVVFATRIFIFVIFRGVVVFVTFLLFGLLLLSLFGLL